MERPPFQRDAMLGHVASWGDRFPHERHLVEFAPAVNKGGPATIPAAGQCADLNKAGDNVASGHWLLYAQ